MLQTDEIVDHLVSLFKLDVDAVHAYDEAIKNIDAQDIKDQLSNFKQDHERHITDLSRAISKFGKEAPERTRDFKGFLISGFTSIRSSTGTEGALKAMKTNEELTNSSYSKALSFDLPGDIKSLIERNYDDEKRHLSYINNSLDNKLFERAA